MSTEMVVRFCSPTLAGLKVANMFSVRCRWRDEIMEHLAYYNNLLNEKGLYFKLLKYENEIALIYVYRKQKLKEILQQKEVIKVLKSYGYDEMDMKTCLEKLMIHLEKKEFPHEIGIFLGYPIADVKAFIEHKGEGHKCVGCWKVYTNEQEAKATFCKFDKCTKIYYEKLLQGTEITRLTVVV
ncbi:MAG: DUF3793 family protein [Eubacteriales bacterium]